MQVTSIRTVGRVGGPPFGYRGNHVPFFDSRHRMLFSEVKTFLEA